MMPLNTPQPYQTENEYARVMFDDSDSISYDLPESSSILENTVINEKKCSHSCKHPKRYLYCINCYNSVCVECSNCYNLKTKPMSTVDTKVLSLKDTLTIAKKNFEKKEKIKEEFLEEFKEIIKFRYDSMIKVIQNQMKKTIEEFVAFYNQNVKASQNLNKLKKELRLFELDMNDLKAGPDFVKKVLEFSIPESIISLKDSKSFEDLPEGIDSINLYFEEINLPKLMTWNVMDPESYFFSEITMNEIFSGFYDKKITKDFKRKHIMNNCINFKK